MLLKKELNLGHLLEKLVLWWVSLFLDVLGVFLSFVMLCLETSTSQPYCFVLDKCPKSAFFCKMHRLIKNKIETHPMY
jgi:hypothetical protein